MRGSDFVTPDDPKPVPEEWVWERIRNERNKRLSECDWTQLPDAPVDAAVWAEYRQSLRDLPESSSDPLDVVFPSKPLYL